MKNTIVPAVFVTVAGFGAPALGELPPMSELVDERAMVVVEVEDFGELMDAAERAGLRELMESREVEEFLKAYFAGDEAGEDAGLAAVLERLGVAPDAVGWPTGRAGLALSLPSDVRTVIESEDFAEDEIEYRMAVYADFGEGADDVREALESLVDHGLEKGYIEIDSDQRVGETRVLTLRSIVRTEFDRKWEEFYAEYQEKSEAAETDEDYEALWNWWEENTPGSEFEGVEGVDAAILSIFYASPEFAYGWADETLVVTNHGESMLDLLHAAEDGLDDPAADAPFFVDALGGLAERPQVRAAVDLGAFFELAIANAQRMAEEQEFDPFSGMQEVGFDLLGMRSMEGLGAALSLDTPELVDARVRLVAEEKTGWMRLIDLPGEAIEAPSFIPARASAVTIIRADFARVTELVEGAIENLPEEQRQMMGGQLQQFNVVARPILAAMGDRLVTWSLPAEREQLAQNPLVGSMIAIPVKDAEPMRNALAGLTPMIGLSPREFGGAQIYESPDVPMALGLGNGWLVVGATTGVEDVLRLAGEPRDGGIGRSEEFREVVEALGDPSGIALSYLSGRRYLEQLYEAAEAWDEQQAEWWGDEWPEQRPGWLDELPDIEMLREHLGDMGASVRSTERGFESRMVLTRPQ